MKKTIIIIVAALVLVVGGFFLYVSNIDWNANKDRIASQFANVTGKDVVFDGSVGFKIFPSPYLSAKNIKIYDKNRSANPNPLATIRELQVQLTLASMLSGNFDVKKMVVVEPEMIIETLPEGKINWQSPINYDQQEKIDVVLDRVIIENAKLHIVSRENALDVSLDNLNAEVKAESIFGPYEIEGTYMKDESPEGFSLKLGKFSDAFDTTLNFAINHPKSSSYISFDGSFFLRNNVLKGDVVFESGNLVEFMTSYLKLEDVGQEFNHPLMISLEVNTDRSKLQLSNFAVKFGETLGAGNVLVPLNQTGYDEQTSSVRKKVEVSFNMTDLYLEPFVVYGHKILKQYEGDKSFDVDLGFDLLFDLKSIKTFYKAEEIREFAVSLDVLKENIVVNSLSAMLPGETAVSLKGKVFKDKTTEQLAYNATTGVSTMDALYVANWLGYEVPSYNKYAYKTAEFAANVRGDMGKIEFSSAKFKFDKTNMEGALAVSRGDKTTVAANLSVDSINLDNYTAKMPEDVASGDWERKIKYILASGGIWDEYNFDLKAIVGLAIYNATPFENVEIDVMAKDGVFNFERFDISSVKNSSIGFRGELRPFGEKISFTNLKYEIGTQDLYSLFDKEMIPEVIQNAKDLKKLDIKGIVTGDFGRLVTKSFVKLDNIDLVYSGEISQGQDLKFDGKIELKAPDFIKFLNRVGIEYNPRVLTMGIFRMAADLQGVFGKYEMNNLDLYIGSNRFTGAVSYDKTADKPSIGAKLKINKFEVDRFLYNRSKGVDTPGVFNVNNAETVDFLAQLFFDKVSIDYSPYFAVDLNAELEVGSLAYKNFQAKDVSFGLDIRDNRISLSDFRGTYGESVLGGNGVLDVAQKTVRGTVDVKRMPFNGKMMGTKYGVEEGVLDLSADFMSAANSEYEFMTNLDGSVRFNIYNPLIAGWDLDVIWHDLQGRKDADGIVTFVQGNLQKGKTRFDNIKGNVSIAKGNFNFSNASLVSDIYEIVMSGSGSLVTWEMNEAFDVVFRGLPEGLGVKFFMTGSMDRPEVSVDVSSISNYFAVKDKKAAEDQMAAEVEEFTRLNSLMKEERAGIEALQKELSGYITLVRDRLELVGNEIIKKEYEDIDKGLQGIRVETEKAIMKAGVNADDVTDELINEVRLSNEKIKQEIDAVAPRIDMIHLQDVKDWVNRKHSTVSSRFRASRQKVLEYRNEAVEYPQRMVYIGKTAVLEDDPKVHALRESIEAAFLRLDEMNTIAAKDYVKVQSVSNVEELEQYGKSVDDMLVSYTAEELKMENDIMQALAYMEKVVKKAEEEHEQVLLEADAERKRQEEEKNKPVSVQPVVVETLSDVKEAPLIEGETVPEKVKGGSVIKVEQAVTASSSTAITNESKAVLKKVDGEVSKASGSIIKK